jgi:hypothetical protein
MIWFFSAVKPDNPTVPEEKYRDELGSSSFTSFDLPVWAGLAQNTTDCGNFTTSNAGLRISAGVPEARTPASTIPGRLRGMRLPVITV